MVGSRCHLEGNCYCLKQTKHIRIEMETYKNISLSSSSVVQSRCSSDPDKTYRQTQTAGSDELQYSTSMHACT